MERQTVNETRSYVDSLTTNLTAEVQGVDSKIHWINHY